MTKHKHLLSFIVLAAFGIFAAASCANNKLVPNSIAQSKSDESDSESGTYVIKEDGTKLYAKEISWGYHALGNEWIKADGKRIDADKLRGIKMNDDYYGRVKGGFAKRIIHGKVNVYTNTFRRTMTRGINGTSSYDYEVTYYYCQKGEEEPAVTLESYDQIRKFIGDCPLAVSMLNGGKKEIKSAIKADGAYLNKVFEIYNNNCKPVK